MVGWGGTYFVRLLMGPVVDGSVGLGPVMGLVVVVLGAVAGRSGRGSGWLYGVGAVSVV